MTEHEAFIVSAYTGRFLLPREKFLDLVEKRLGRSIFSHNLGNPWMWQELRRDTEKEFFALYKDNEEERRESLKKENIE